MADLLREWLRDPPRHLGVAIWKELFCVLSLLLLLGCGKAEGGDVATEALVQPKGPSAESLGQRRWEGAEGIELGDRWIISAEEARSLVAQGATFLDARGKGTLSQGFGKGSFEGAIAVTWQQFSEPEAPHRGNLLADEALLTQKLQAIGISQNKPVVVFADPSQGWGEAGRIVWMLRSLGHKQSLLVNGGAAALQKAGVAQGKAIQQAEKVGNMAIVRQFQWEIDQASLKAELDAALALDAALVLDTALANTAQADANQPHSSQLKTGNLVLVDTREPREYAGATPYGESRGGHLPGAVNLHFEQLLDEAGFLLTKAQIQARLSKLGITPESRIVAYCTGGIRSGWLTVVLRDLGYDVRNYAGSMWEWSAGATEEYPLAIPPAE